MRAHTVLGRNAMDELRDGDLLGRGRDEHFLVVETRGFRDEIGLHRIAHAFRQVRRRIAHDAEHVARLHVPLLRGQAEEQRRETVVAREAAAVRVDPAQVVLGLGVAQPGRFAVGSPLRAHRGPAARRCRTGVARACARSSAKRAASGCASAGPGDARSAAVKAPVAACRRNA